LRAARKSAAERFQNLPLPTSELEEWRYSQIDALDLDRYRIGVGGPTGPTSQPSGPGQPGLAHALVSELGPGVTLIETHDGQVVQAHGSDRAVIVERLSAPDAREVELGELAGEPDAFAVLNRAFAPAPVRITVSPGSAPKPVVVVHRAETDGSAVFPRLLVQLGEQSQVSVLEVVAGSGAALVVPVTELEVGEGAALSYLHVQDLGPRAWQIGLQASRVGRDASVLSAAVALGGDYARLRTDSALVAPGASGRLLALYFGAASQMHDFRTVQHHRAAKTRSELLYKGVVANRSRSVYSGLIRVDKGARGTNAFQTNRNLVLHEGAHADSVPNLEIEDNDVRCSHASAVGPIAEDQRFYLESRGVPASVTDRLIALGFLDDVLAQVPLPPVVTPVRAALASKLVDAEAIESSREEFSA
jgi:Fe-S cluster assembly protein SufD